jgi:8-oxo-dGTP pyrophosphatase MutT (NUDIX family)
MVIYFYIVENVTFCYTSKHMREAILYAFVLDGKILVEERLKNEEEVIGLMIPGGGIEEHDKKEGIDYREHAFFREVSEELGEHVVVDEHFYLGPVIKPETGTPFHVFYVSSWQGDLPEYIIEDGKRDGRLQWMTIREAEEQSDNPVTIYALQKIQAHLEDAQ